MYVYVYVWIIIIIIPEDCEVRKKGGPDGADWEKEEANHAC